MNENEEGTAMPTFDTPEPISVDVELGVGDIRIEASDRADTIVEVRPSDPTKTVDRVAAEDTHAEYANGHLSVNAPGGGWRQWLPRRSESIDVTIHLPAGSRCMPTGVGRSAPAVGSARADASSASATPSSTKRVPWT
jgi:hypothetical protein